MRSCVQGATLPSNNWVKINHWPEKKESGGQKTMAMAYPSMLPKAASDRRKKQLGKRATLTRIIQLAWWWWTSSDRWNKEDAPLSLLLRGKRRKAAQNKLSSLYNWILDRLIIHTAYPCACRLAPPVHLAHSLIKRIMPSQAQRMRNGQTQKLCKWISCCMWCRSWCVCHTICLHTYICICLCMCALTRDISINLPGGATVKLSMVGLKNNP